MFEVTYSEAGHGIKCEVAVAIAASSLPVQNHLGSRPTFGSVFIVKVEVGRCRKLIRRRSLWNRVAIAYRWKSYVHFRFGGWHLESVINIIGVMPMSVFVDNVGYWNYVCMSLRIEVSSTR
jgi:hypothetical protein